MASVPLNIEIERGDYVEQTLRHVDGRTKLPWYLLPPSNGYGIAPLHHGLDAGAVFGPVHDVESTLSTHGGFVSVLVPTPWTFLPRADWDSLPLLIWINVYKAWDRNGNLADVHWCRRVPDATVQSWRNQGWQDVMLD